jgi:hypothetical protein
MNRPFGPLIGRQCSCESGGLTAVVFSQSGIFPATVFPGKPCFDGAPSNLRRLAAALDPEPIDTKPLHLDRHDRTAIVPLFPFGDTSRNKENDRCGGLQIPDK